MIPFDEQEERIRLANERLRNNLIVLRNISGAGASDVLLYSVGNAGIGTLAETIETLMACVDAIATRVTLLEQDV